MGDIESLFLFRAQNMNMKILTSGAMIVAVLALSSAAANAGTVFDNGYAPIYTGNNPEAQGNYVAQDFNLAANTSLTGFVYNAFTTTDTVPVTAVNLNIYTDASNAPGSELYSGTFTVDTQTVTDTLLGYTQVDFHSTLPGWTLAAGNYFLALNVQPSQWDMHWTVPQYPTLPGNNYISTSGTPGTFTQYSLDQSFRLEGGLAGVPEPATWAMMLVGFGGIGAAMRSRRKLSGAVAA